MTRGFTIAFHSYKGGTGKTTLISNLASLFALEGMNVGLLDFDLYAPSLTMYFEKKPDAYVNNLLRGDLDEEKGQVNVAPMLVDMSSELKLKGKLLLAFSNPQKSEIDDIEFRHSDKWQNQALKRFQSAKNRLFEEYNLDYLFLDTSPGIRSWSINTLATAKMLFLVMKASDMDIKGTKEMIKDIYNQFIRYGKSKYIILNKVPDMTNSKRFGGDLTELTWSGELQKDIGTQVVGSVPCCCDIQFSRHEFLYAVKHPEHPFSRRVADLAERIAGLG